MDRSSSQSRSTVVLYQSLSLRVPFDSLKLIRTHSISRLSMTLPLGSLCDWGFREAGYLVGMFREVGGILASDDA